MIVRDIRLLNVVMAIQPPEKHSCYHSEKSLWTSLVLGISPLEATMSFTALTIIDTVTNLVELVRLDNKTAANVALQFENTWLARYPKPMRCIHD